MSTLNHTSRLEAFCDGVFAIAITLLIIDIKIPETAEINSSTDLWEALEHIAPSISAFLLSFVVILITWVNHHNHLKLLNRSSSTYLYANGFLLLTVAFTPFPTSLLGEYILTDHAAPAVILYNVVLAFQALGWVLMTNSALANNLGKSEKANVEIKLARKFSYFACALYSLCAILGIWFPHIIAVFTTLTWIFWLIYGINIKHEEAI
jgi:uncharacterized membrane protein